MALGARTLVDTLRLSPPRDSAGLARVWSEVDDVALVDLAEYEGASHWLARRLKALGITLSPAAAAQLAATVKRGIAQSLRVDAECAATLDAFHAAGIPAVPLKAAAMRRIADRVPYADARAPNDVDILVPAAEAQRAFDLLVGKGYVTPRDSAPPDHHHLPALAGPLGIGVELHLSTSAHVPPDEAWRRATHDGATATIGGRAHMVPGATELLWHAAMHAVTDAEDYARVGARLRYWVDAAALLASGEVIDWARIRERLASGEVRRPDAVRAWLRTAAFLGGVTLPDTAIPGDGRIFDVERLIAWRLHVVARHGRGTRWSRNLIEEGARGEAGLPIAPAQTPAAFAAIVRHAIAACAARVWWMLRR